MNTLFVLIFAGGLHEIYSQQNFTGHKLIAAFPSSVDEVNVLRLLRSNTEVDIWNEPIATYEKVNIRLPPEIADEVEEELKNSGIDYYLVTDNLQDWVDREIQQNPKDEARTPEEFRLDLYHRYNEIMAYLDSLGTNGSGSVSVMTIGTTSQGNAIKGVKIGNGGGSNKSAIWIDAGIHSREWVAPATALYIIDHLFKRGSDERIKKALDAFDWYIVPLANPDGYVYTWTKDRMWRKNRVVSGTSFFRTCYGVDPNRNFDAEFGGLGTSRNPCSNIYPGARAFSEIESRSIRDAVLPIKDRLKAFISIHSYSQLWMCPYGYKRTRPTHYQDMMSALQNAVNATVAKHGERYRYGRIANMLSPASGSSVDWAYDALGVKYSFALELRDRGQYGFILPRQYIKPTAEEALEGILAVAEHISNEL